MATPTVRFGGGVWKHQEDVRADLQRRLDESTAMVQHANAEVDRVHAQCVVLLRDKNELAVSLSEAEAQLRRQSDELHAAKQNVTELMALLTQANETRTRVETELASVAKLWEQTRDHEQQLRQDNAELRKYHEADEQEAHQLRDLLYETQERTECQHQELTRYKRHLEVAVHSNEAKDRQILTLIRERDAFAQKLAQYRGRITMGKPLPPRGEQALSLISPVVRSPMEDSCENVTWTEIPPETESSIDQNVVEFERQKQRLREVARQSKVRLEKERAQNKRLCERIDALEKSQQELLVRYREAAKAQRKRAAGSKSPIPCEPTTAKPESLVQAA